VLRTALVGVGKQGAQQPVLVYELQARASPPMSRKWTTNCAHIADGIVHTAQASKVFLHAPRAFPVDIRHNAKIGREKLAAWASKQAIKEQHA
jgi:hypothetical protein